MSRKRIAFLYLGVGVTLLIVTFFVLQRAGVSRSFVENLLAKIIVRDRFELGDATLSLGDGRLTLDEFEITTPDGAPERPLVAVDRVEVDVDTNPLGSVGRIRQVRLEGLHLDLDLSSGKAPDLSMILEAGDESAGPADPPPAVFIDNAGVTLRFAPDAQPIEFTEVQLQLLPDEDAVASRMILSGSMVSPAGLATTVRGSADFQNKQFRALLEIVDFPLDPSLAARFSPAIGDMLEAAELGGRAEKLRLWIEYQENRADGEDLVAGVNLDLDDLRGVPPAIRYPLFGATARISASTRAGGSVRFELRDEASHGDVVARGELTNCFDDPIARVEVEANDVLVSPELRDAMSSTELLERIWRSFTPLSGRIDTRFLLATTDDPAKPRVDLDLKLKGVTVDWNGVPTQSSIRPYHFPEPLTEANGEIHLRGGRLRIEALQFGACGADAQIDGSIGIGGDSSSTLEIRSDRVEFGERVRAAMAAVLPMSVPIYDEYAPRGAAGLHLAIQSRDGDSRPDVRLKIRPLGASAEYQGFPCRLEELRGLVEIEPRGVSFDLNGRRGPATAKLHGRFFHQPRDAEAAAPLRSELWIDVDGFEIDADLGRAVATIGPEIEETWKFLAPSGRADCEFTLWRGHEAETTSYDLRIDPRDAEVQLETLPIPIRKVRGPIFVHGNGPNSRVDIGVVHGELGSGNTEPAKVTVQGEIITTASGNSVDIVSVTRNLSLTDQLRDALDTGEVFSAETWDVLAPSGKVDVIARQVRDLGAEKIAVELDITMLGTESHAAMLPAPATNMRGRVILRDGVATFRDVRCSMAGAEVLCSRGVSTHDGSSSRVRATVSCDDFPIDDNLANLLSGPMRATYLDRRFDGHGQINDLDLNFVFPDDDASAFTLDVGGRFDVRNLSLSLGARFEDVVGSWRIRQGHVDATGGFVRGSIENAGFSVAGHRVNGAMINFNADADRLELNDVGGRLHNGMLFGIGDDQPDVLYEFAGEGLLRAFLGWRQVSLSSALRVSGMSAKEYRGNLSGQLHLQELVGSNIVGAVAHGEAHITDGQLGTVPMFTSIYSHLSPNRRPRFNAVSALFQLAERKINVSSIDIHSPLLSVSGRGSVTMGGYVDMVLDFSDLFGSGADWLVLPRIAGFLTSGVVRFQVHGYLRNPRATPQWLWESKADEIPIGPIPARQR